MVEEITESGHLHLVTGQVRVTASVSSHTNNKCQILSRERRETFLKTGCEAAERSCDYRSDHDQANQEADDAHEQQQQLPAVASSDQVGVQISHRRHQGLQAHKLGVTGNAGLSMWGGYGT